MSLQASVTEAEPDRPEEEPADADSATEADVELDADPLEPIVLTVASATGGCGKTFFATNLAAMLGKLDRSVLLLDLDLQFGEVAAVLRLGNPYSLYDGLYGANGRALPEAALKDSLHELVAGHPLGFDVLTAPRDPALADHISGTDVERVLEAVSSQYDVVVIDTPPSLNEAVLAALDRSDRIIAVASLDVPSLKNLHVFLDTLARLKIGEDSIRLILNKVDRDIGIDAKQAQLAYDNKFVGTIPQSRSVARAMNVGTVVIESEPSSRAARELLDAIVKVVPAELSNEFQDATEVASGRGLSGLLRKFTGKGGS